MTAEREAGEALAAEAERLAEKQGGESDLVRAGLADFAERHGMASGADELQSLANLAALRYRAAWYSKVGYLDLYAWLDTLQDDAADMGAPAPAAEEVGEIFLAAWRARVAEQRTWPEETDNDRLSRAFAALNRGGIVAREDFTCCQRCAGSEIFDEIPAGAVPDGFVFFHRQDTLDAAAGRALLLGFGAFVARDDDADAGPGPRVRHAPVGDAAHVAVAERAVAALAAEGLRTRWDGSTARRISVDVDWKRRLQPH